MQTEWYHLWEWFCGFLAKSYLQCEISAVEIGEIEMNTDRVIRWLLLLKPHVIAIILAGTGHEGCSECRTSREYRG